MNEVPVTRVKGRGIELPRRTFNEQERALKSKLYLLRKAHKEGKFSKLDFLVAEKAILAMLASYKETFKKPVVHVNGRKPMGQPAMFKVSRR